MSTRIFFAGILGGIVMFIWSFIAHELLPIGELGVREIPNEDAVTSAIESNRGDKIGFYIFPSPGLSPGATRAEKEEGMKKAEQKMASWPPGVLIYHPKSGLNVPRRLGLGVATGGVEALQGVFVGQQTK